MFTRFFKFAVVGFLGFCVHIVIFTLLDRAGIYYLLASLIAFLIAATHNFLWNYFWTFKNKEMQEISNINRYVRFVAISSICLSINLMVLFFLVENIYLVKWQAQVIAVLFVSLLSFTLQNSLTFGTAESNNTTA